MNTNGKVLDALELEAKEGRLYLHCEIEDEVALWIALHLDRCERDKNIDEVTLDINTNGGTAPEMWHLSDRIRTMTTPVTTVCSGYAHSAGFIILAAGKIRKTYPHSSLLFHGANFWTGWNKSPELMDRAEQAKRVDEKMCKFLAEVTRKGIKHWRGIVASNKDRYVTAEEALEWGVVDEIIGGK